MEDLVKCKICESEGLTVFAHTASCVDCGVLLCYPYPDIREDTFLQRGIVDADERAQAQSEALQWHLSSGARNHHNFTDMALFALTDSDRDRDLEVLDFGGGGGQFALVLQSLFPMTSVCIVDMNDERLLDGYRPLNDQIRFEEFDSDDRRFDVIFMNDVFEHVSDPVGVLTTLRSKLNPGGRIFIDTPCHFWLYPLTKLLSKGIHTKLLNGTVDFDHQQIWSKKSFSIAVERAGLVVDTYAQKSEFTQGADFYMDNMEVGSGVLRFGGKIFFAVAPFVARNKIMAVVSPRN